MGENIGSLVVRVVVGCLVTYGLFQRYLPEVKETGASWATVRAANMGYPFYNYFSEITPERPFNPKELDRLHSNDYGIGIFVSMISVVGRTLSGPDFKVSGRTGVQILVVMLSAIVLVFMSPFFPLPLSLAAVGATVFYLLTFSDNFLKAEITDNRWVVGIGCILMTMFLFGSTFERPYRRVTLAVLGILMGILILLRQDTQIFYMATIFLGVLAALLGYRFFKSDSVRWQEVKRFTKLFLFMFMFAVFSNLAIKGILSYTYKSHFLRQPVPSHGAGFPLFLAQGVFANPYNLSWQDEVGYLHHRLYSHGLGGSWEEANLALQRESMKDALWIMVTDPVNTFRQVWGKTKFLARFLLRPEITERNKENYALNLVYPRWAVLLTVLFLVLTTFVTFLSLWRPQNLVLGAFYFAATAAGFVSPILIYYGYLLSAVGSMLAAVFLWPAYIYLIAKKRIQFNSGFNLVQSALLELLRTKGKRMALAAVGFFVVWFGAAAGFHAFGAWRVLSDPVKELSRRGAAFSFIFNRLDGEEQVKVMDALKTGESCQGVTMEGTGQDPVEIVWGKNLPNALVLFLKRSAQVVKPVPAPRQGFSTYRLTIRPDPVPEMALNNDYNAKDRLFLDLNDLSSAGKYQMVALPRERRADSLKFFVHQKRAPEGNLQFPPVLVSSGALKISTCL